MVGGFQPFTATDYPGKLAAVVFVQGCAWRCGYCHNPHLQPRTAAADPAWSDIARLLQRRIGLIDAVVFSGGEPTTDAALGRAIGEVKSMGYAVGLHSAGIYPERLQEILPQLDWIGLDVKAPFDERYDRVARAPGSGALALASARAVLSHQVEHEFRTTWHPALLDTDDLIQLAEHLAQMGVRRYALQSFRNEGCANASLTTFPVATRRPGAALLNRLESLFEHFTWRDA
jgi:pyruvate formate lyase activating enzyme